MAQAENNVARFAGPSMIQDSDHLSGIPEVQNEDARQVRQAEQGQSERKSTVNRDGQFEYHNPRQYS
jgi:hypothetical protein